MEDLKKKIWIVMAIACLISAVSSAGVTYSFTVITENSPVFGTIVAGQLFVDVEKVQGNPNQASFTFRNEGPQNSSIAEIYFDDGTILASLDEIIQSPGVAFTGNEFKKVNPGNLPSGEMIDPDFVATASLSSDADPGNGNGVHPGEEITLIFTLVEGVDYDSVITALDSDPFAPGNMRIGLHVRGIDNYNNDGGPLFGIESESYVNNGKVPAPGALLLGGIGVACASWIKRRRFFS